MSEFKTGELEVRVRVDEFEPSYVTHLIGSTVTAVVLSATANGRPIVRRTATGILAGAERFQGYEATFDEGISCDYSKLPRLHFTHGSPMELDIRETDAVVVIKAY